MKTITINYLANERTQYFKPMFNQLIKIKDENKKKINVNMLVSKPHDENIDIKLLTDNGIEAEIIYLPESGRHYMCKVENAVKIAGDYIISLDEDVFLNNHIWDYMIENCDILDDDKNLLTHYKGVHPVRVSEELQSLLVDLVLKHKNKLFEKMDYELFFNNDRPYFCNNVYMIKTSTYRKIIDDASLFVDKFDEVPVNTFRKIHDLNMVFIKNSFGVHPSYNWIGMDRYTELADKFFKGIENG
jgi:hypothetical protein